ncbi:hypothetical protein IJ707_04985 [bacterium]|nr:hypothetical protein [bacterium]
MSYKLEKPYTDKEKNNFIVQYNHQMGLQIEYTKSAIYALEKNEIMQNGEPMVNPDYEIELANIEKEAKLEELKNQLEELDKKRVRAICEPSMRNENQSWLEYYNEQVLQIRQVMAEL